MKKVLLAVCLSMAAVSQQALAEKWSAVGILTTKVDGREAKARFMEIDDFESAEMCWETVKRYSHTREFIGEGGTNHHVPATQWNYDGDCVKKRN